MTHVPQMTHVSVSKFALCPLSHFAIASDSSVAPFRCLAAMPPGGSTRAEILPGRPSLDRGSREPEVGFEPRTFRSDKLGSLKREL
ncbi:hypothetical protein T265_06434 [Opisthorchis viverrini]|uniref:Uncharacterized protein n=1 Tax=Opisthorchis viverrini TaxID=6198 RepID=A0A074ZSH9_OPIVI|nr:hypothetical protein T265_06434 [Opisthorchis viverrini]KER26320.1 hypothetical protein T265_06434 [Opisthorchis viverrini]